MRKPLQVVKSAPMASALLLAALLHPLDGSAQSPGPSPAPASDEAGGFAERYRRSAQRQVTDYSSFRQEYLRRYMAFSAKALETWGSAPISDQHKVVEYSADMSSRVTIDYQNNEMIVEQLVTADQVGSARLEELAKRIANRSVRESAQQDPVNPVRVDDARSLVESAFPGATATLDQQLAQAERVSAPRSLDAEAETQARQEMQRALPPDLSADEKAKVEQTVTQAFAAARAAPAAVIEKAVMKFPSDSQKKRAASFRTQFEAASKRYDVDLALVHAIAQAESSFNPQARSPIPAFGLMQVVPTSAGRDVNAQLMKTDSNPTVDTLYDATQNPMYGAGYLHILDTRYLKAISNEQSRLYCTIAAYNTGAGNVASVFHPQKQRKVDAAAKVINTMTPDQVYSALATDLPYEETRNYLKKVSGFLLAWQKELAVAPAP